MPRRRRARAGRKAAILATQINPAPLPRRPLHSRKTGRTRTGISAAAIVAERRKWQRRRRQIAAIKTAQRLPTRADPARKWRFSQTRTESISTATTTTITARAVWVTTAAAVTIATAIMAARTSTVATGAIATPSTISIVKDAPTIARPGAGGQRHDFSGFRDFHRDFRASHRFQVSSYRRPAGWYTHRWAFGEFLPTAFWARDYWLMDFAEYDLPPPPYGAVWVRVDRDALLIDEDSGEVITVEYDVFY